MKKIPYSFKTKNRLTVSLEFQKVIDQGKKYNSKYFSLYVLAQGGAKKFGLSTSKGAGTAVLRNRLKRRLREIFRQKQRELEPCWQVMFLKKEAGTLSWEQCQKEIKDLWQRASILKTILPSDRPLKSP